MKIFLHNFVAYYAVIAKWKKKIDRTKTTIFFFCSRNRQHTIFATSKTLYEIASGRLNPNIWVHKGINKHIRQNYFSFHIHFKEQN